MIASNADPLTFTQAPVLARLRDKLAQVVAEQEDRARLAHA